MTGPEQSSRQPTVDTQQGEARFESAVRERAYEIATVAQAKLDEHADYVQSESYGTGARLDLGDGVLVRKFTHADGYGYWLHGGSVEYGATFYNDERPPVVQRASGGYFEENSRSDFIGPASLPRSVEPEHLNSGEIEELAATVMTRTPARKT